MSACWRAICLFAALAAVAPSSDADPDAEVRLVIYIEDIVSRQDQRVAAALAGIDGVGRRMLALRSYLRSGRQLPERWSWTQEQIAAYEGSSEHRSLQEQIEWVRASFAHQNPGFELWVNPQVRSLDRQVESWNLNESVTAAAAGLTIAAIEFVSAPAFPAGNVDRERKAVETFLTGYRPVPTPTVAAPGLSPHGQMRAVDFQVHQGGRIIAGPSSATIEAEWDAAGWSAKLASAVAAAGNRFIGPLASPREPWHFTYSPEETAGQ